MDLKIKEVMDVDDIMKFWELIRSLVGIINNKIVVEVDDRVIVGKKLNKIEEKIIGRIKIRIMREIKEGRKLWEKRIEGILIVEKGNDIEKGGFKGKVRKKNEDIGIGIEGEMDIIKNIIVEIGIVEEGNMINEMEWNKESSIRRLEKEEGR